LLQLAPASKDGAGREYTATKLFAARSIKKLSAYKANKQHKMKNKVIVITGGSSGIG